MASIHLKMPVLIKTVKVEGTPQYYVRPLFVPYPSITNRRLETALTLLQKEIRNQFKDFELDTDSLEQLLWFSFNPALKYHLLDFDFRLGGNTSPWVKGKFGVGVFQIQDLHFALLPRLNSTVIMLEANAIKGDALRTSIEKVLKNLLHDETHLESDASDMDSIYSSSREFIKQVAFNLNFKYASFQYEQDKTPWYYAHLLEMSNFDGSTEIEKVAQDLNSRYPSELGRAFYQDELVEQLYKIIFGKENTPVVLVGPEGVGKHALVQETVWRYQSEFYEKRHDHLETLWLLDPTRIISGMSIQGMWQKRLEAILQYVINKKDQDKLLVDNPVALLRIGQSAQNRMNMSDVLKPWLEKRRLQLVLIATTEEWKIIQEKDRSFSDLFQVIRLQAPDLPTTVRIVLCQRQVLEREYGCVITIQAIHHLFNLHRDFFSNRALPGSVMKMLRQLITKHRFRRIDVPEVQQEFKALSGLADQMLHSGEPLVADNVRQALAQELVGQPDAVEALANVVHLVKARLNDKKRPVGSFLFIGPTGVGKTQAAKVLCRYLKGNEESLLRFDMNEYIDAGAVQRLIGDFYNPEGILTGKVRYQPFGILLLDEIEKAHPKVHDLLLQVLDEGRLTDSLGRAVDFCNTIIVMTSNLGARDIGAQVGFGNAADTDAAIYQKSVRNFFRPEFVNRIDQMVIFNSLNLDHTRSIARLQIQELLRRDGFVRRTTIFNVSKAAIEWVAARGFDVRMGGRALKRQIETDLTTLSAEQLIDLQHETPILFDVDLQHDQLVPRITPLEFAIPIPNDWFPQLPDEKQGKVFYTKLLRAVEALERRILHWEARSANSGGMVALNANDLNWQYYQFKDKVQQTKYNLQNMVLSFRERYLREPPALPLRLKAGNFILRRSESYEKVVRDNLRDQLFQEEGLRELRESYYYTGAQFDSMQTEFLSHFLTVHFLQLATSDVIKSQPTRITLRFHSLIATAGAPEIQYLLELYATLLQDMDIQHELHLADSTIHAEGYGLYELLRGEAGIHLFYIAYQNPLPIHVVIIQQNMPEPPMKPQVIRIYDGSATLTDLRSRFSNAMNITSNEFRLLLYAGWAAHKTAL